MKTTGIIQKSFNYAHLIIVYVSLYIWKNIQKITNRFTLQTFPVTKIKINMHIIIYNIIVFKSLEDQKYGVYMEYQNDTGNGFMMNKC